MKLFYLFVISITLFLLTSLQANCQESLYKKALKKGTIEIYEEFLQKYPSSQYTKEISDLYEDLLYSKHYYGKLILKFPEGKYLNEALSGLFESYTKKHELSKAILEFFNYIKQTPQVEDSAVVIIRQKTDNINSLATLLKLKDLTTLPQELQNFYNYKLKSISVTDVVKDTTYLFSNAKSKYVKNCSISITGKASIKDDKYSSIKVKPNSKNDLLTIHKSSILILSSKKNTELKAENELLFNALFEPENDHIYYLYSYKNGTYTLDVSLAPIITFQINGVNNDTVINLSGSSAVLENKETNQQVQQNMQSYKSIDNNLIEINNGLILMPTNQYFWIFDNLGIKGGGVFIENRKFYILPGTERIYRKE